MKKRPQFLSSNADSFLVMKKDELFEIFKKKLNTVDPEKYDTEKLVTETASEYLERLLETGHIPSQFAETVEKDIQDEVLEMFRKQTYGFHDLKDYKKSQKSTKSRSRAT